MSCDPNILTVAELKEKLKMHKLSTAGTKAKLITRLYDPKTCELDSDVGVEQKLYKYEKLAEHELDLALREILLCGQLRENFTSGVTELINNEEMSRSRPRINLAMVADLLSDFDGVSNDFDMWEKQVRFLKATY
ncbi:hypothetical protein ACFW04_000792 [Cataglyphis niger]